MTEDEETARLKAVHNERTKLAAAYMNGIAIATIAVGGLTPAISSHFELMGPVDVAIFGFRLILCVVVSGILHLGAVNLLRRLR